MNKELTPLEALEIICGELVEMDLLFIDGNRTNQQKWFKTQAHKNSIEFNKKYGSPTSIIEKSLKALDVIKEKKWLVEDIINAFIEDKEKYDLLKEILL